MRIFLSYASAQRPLAERINQLLQSEGHSVFFDRDDLPAGETYGDRIRVAVARCHVFIFLVAPDSVSAGSYALTELAFAEQLPRRQAPAMIPVLAAPIASMDMLPPFLAPLTLLEPRGDVAAEVAAKVAGIAARRRRRHGLLGAGALAAAIMLVAGALLLRDEFRPETTRPPAMETPPATPPPVADVAAEKKSRVAEADRARLIGMPSSGGWMVSVDIADRQVREIFYALDDAPTFTSTGFQSSRQPETGLPLPQMQILLPGALGQERNVSLKYTDSEGRERGPYRLTFDPKAEYVRFTKSVLNMTSWLTFREYPRGKLLVYFSHLLSYKNAFSEIRYSVDDDTLSRRVTFTPDWSKRGPPGLADGDLVYTEIPMTAKSVSVKLVFIDGTESALKHFSILEAGVSR